MRAIRSARTYLALPMISAWRGMAWSRYCRGATKAALCHKQFIWAFQQIVMLNRSRTDSCMPFLAGAGELLMISYA